MPRKKPHKPIRLIRRGFQGWHANGVHEDGHSFSSTGGDLDPYRFASRPQKGYRQQAPDGTPVTDASHLEGTEDDTIFIRWVVGGPIPDPLLAPGMVRDWGESTLYVEGMKIGPMTEVAIDVYVRLMREAVPKARFGVVKRSRVVWE